MNNCSAGQTNFFLNEKQNGLSVVFDLFDDAVIPVSVNAIVS